MGFLVSATSLAVLGSGLFILVRSSHTMGTDAVATDEVFQRHVSYLFAAVLLICIAMVITKMFE